MGQGRHLRMEGIVRMLAADETVNVEEMAQRLDVTTMTIRRDLDQLAAEGRVIRTHGGAVLAAPAMVAFAFQAQRKSRMAAKRAIAHAAVARIQPGMSLILDTGTTTLELARLLGGIPRLKVLTSSLAIASTLLANTGLELILVGGTVNANSPDLSGPLTIGNLAMFHVDLAFVGADGVSPTGFSTRSQPIAAVSRAILNSADRAILLADSHKFGQDAFVRIAGWDALDDVIVDEELPAAQRAWVRDHLRVHTLAPLPTDARE